MGSIGKKNAIFAPFDTLIKKRSFYQDGLGRSIGKVEKRVAFSSPRLPLRGRKLNVNVSHQDKVYAFGRIVYEWMQHRYIEGDMTELAPTGGNV